MLMLYVPKFKPIERRYRRLLKEPLQVDCELSTPAIVYQWIYFDGLLAFCVVDRYLQTELFNEEQAYFVPLPLEQRGSEHWYWAASVGLYEKAVWSRTMWRKDYRTWDGDDLGYGVIEFNYQMPMPALSIERIRFFCVGNKHEVETLIQRITHVGKKRAYGYGAVKRWSVTVIDKDCSEIVNKTLVRPIPVSECRYRVIGETGLHGYRPPYWCPENFTECWLPGGIVKDVSL